jgi:hypothetical protein
MVLKINSENVSRLLLAQILEEELGTEKKLWVRKWLARSIHMAA